MIVYLLTQVWLLITSLTKTTVTAPEQLSVAVIADGFGTGTEEGHSTVTGAGQVMEGAVLSFTVITWVQVAELPQTSVAL